MPAAIEAHDLVKSFKGGVKALDGVSFVVEEGTVFGLLGPNGAGKTTVVRILTTILRADSGTATVLGHDVAREPELVRSLFGLAGQYAAVDENLTGRENLRMIGRLNHLPSAVTAERSVELLEDFQLTDAADRTLKTYSGGMRRRLDLAAALVARPSVLFLDEPTTGLDPQSRIGLWGVIEGLVERGTTVLLTTQYLEEADRLASHLAVVDHGHLISQGSPSELKAELGATVLEVGLPDVVTAERAAKALARLSGKRLHIAGNSVELPVDGGPQIAMEALRALDQEGIEPTRFALREPSLDDVFLSLTGRRAEGSDPSDAAAGPEASAAATGSHR
ncbi:MAG: daunorubicin resistance transporter ATPase subunit [Acidimicrobiaceae bacterium]|jgi:ABC-2 type transport system ATP-binding protein|nr:daunorubicin resistance transporter ATPase subunit [Acidimicrobiaceae bacterium]